MLLLCFNQVLENQQTVEMQHELQHVFGQIIATSHDRFPPKAS